MNNTEHRSNPIRNEQTGTPLHKNEVVSINNELNFELLSARQQLTRILTAAKVPSVDEVVVLLERKRDSQGFLINTDFDDTMSKPLSDEEIEQAAKKYAENENSAYTNDYYGFIAGANFSNSPQAGWVDVKDVKDFLFMMSERHEDKLCFDIADIIKFTSQPLPPKPKQ